MRYSALAIAQAIFTLQLSRKKYNPNKYCLCI